MSDPLQWAIRVRVEIDKKKHLILVGEDLCIKHSSLEEAPVAMPIKKFFTKCQRRGWRAWVSN